MIEKSGTDNKDMLEVISDNLKENAENLKNLDLGSRSSLEIIAENTIKQQCL